MPESITLSENSLKTARAFAAKSVSSSLDQYARRHQTDPRQIQHQIEIGKLGEFAAFKWLNSLSLPVSTPDIEVYEAKRKSFAPDMFVFVDGFGEIPIHVKTQDRESANRFGISWTFQYGINVGNDKEIFVPNPKGYVVFVLLENNIAQIYGAPYVSTLHEYNLFRDPKLHKLRGIKTVVYNDDLSQLPHDVLWALTDIPKI